MPCYYVLVRTIAVAAQKGGAGKTTITVHIAVAAMLAGERVAIVDTDPQRTALAWAQTRAQDSPTVVATARVDEAKREAASDGFTILLIDTAPVAAAATSAHLRAADFRACASTAVRVRLDNTGPNASASSSRRNSGGNRPKCLPGSGSGDCRGASAVRKRSPCARAGRTR